MHTGAHNRESDHLTAEQHLIEVDQQGDLEVLITNDLKWGRQVDASYKKYNIVFGLYAEIFPTRTRTLCFQRILQS